MQSTDLDLSIGMRVRIASAHERAADLWSATAARLVSSGAPSADIMAARTIAADHSERAERSYQRAEQQRRAAERQRRAAVTRDAL